MIELNLSLSYSQIFFSSIEAPGDPRSPTPFHLFVVLVPYGTVYRANVVYIGLASWTLSIDNSSMQAWFISITYCGVCS
jgi:hypothetical protein